MSVKLISQRTIHYSACRQAAEYSLTLERKGQYNPSKNGSMKIKHTSFFVAEIKPSDLMNKWSYIYSCSHLRMAVIIKHLNSEIDSNEEIPTFAFCGPTLFYIDISHVSDLGVVVLNNCVQTAPGCCGVVGSWHQLSALDSGTFWHTSQNKFIFEFESLVLASHLTVPLLQN